MPAHLTAQAGTTAPQSPPTTQTIPGINLTFSADALLLLGAGVYLIWNHLMKPSIAKRLDGVWAPIEEERRLTAILAQIGIITNASRVVLAAFHNGQLSRYGFHLQKLTTVNQYTAPDFSPMPYPIRDLPIGRVMTEVEMLIADGGWVETQASGDLPDACIDHLKRNRIARMLCRIVLVGNLPIGILSIQYGEQERRRPQIAQPPHDQLLESLFDEISTIMRRRIVHPSPLHRLAARFFGSSTPIAKE